MAGNTICVRMFRKLVVRAGKHPGVTSTWNVKIEMSDTKKDLQGVWAEYWRMTWSLASWGGLGRWEKATQAEGRGCVMGPSLHAHGGMQKNVWPTCSGGRNTEGWAHRGELGDQPGRWSFQSFSVRCDYHLEHSRRTVSKEWEDSIFVLQMLI